MLRRVVGQLVWILIIAAVVNGIAGLCLAALRLAGVISGSWSAVLAPLWLPLLIASILEIVLLQIIWTSTSVRRPREEKRVSAAGR